MFRSAGILFLEIPNLWVSLGATAQLCFLLTAEVKKLFEQVNGHHCSFIDFYSYPAALEVDKVIKAKQVRRFPAQIPCRWMLRRITKATGD